MKKALAVLVAAVFFMGVGVALADIQASTPRRFITGCIHKDTKVLRVKSTCSTSETSISWVKNGMSGWTVSHASTANNTTPDKTATAQCPAGMRVLGGGAHGASATDMYLQASFPQHQGTNLFSGWAVYARVTNGSSWPLHVYAICAYPG